MTDLRIDDPELFHLLVDSVRDYAIFVLDPEGHVVTWNRGAQRIKGYAAEEIIGKHFSLFYPTSDIRSGKPDYELLAASEVGRFEDEGWRIRQDGSRFWANVLITAMRDKDDQLVGFAKVTRDLTERKQASDEREALLAAEREARAHAETARARLEAVHSVTDVGLLHSDQPAMFESMLDIVRDLMSVDMVALFLRDGDSMELVATRGLDDALGVGLRIPVGQGFVGRLAVEKRPVAIEDLRYADLATPRLRDMGVSSLLGAPLMAEGEVLGALHVGTVRHRRFPAEDIALLEVVAERMALAIDRTRALEAERRARADTIAAQQTARLREQFLAVAAHELKTPLTGLRMGAQLALRRGAAEGLAPSVQTLIEQIVKEADRLNLLVMQLLDASRADGAQLSVSRSQTDVSQLLLDRVEIMRHFHDRDIEAVIPADVQAEIDALRIDQVVTNLLDNAVKFSARGAQIILELESTEEGVNFSVLDRGRGIPVDRRERIFERFFRADDASNESGGLGLGLSISKDIVDAHGGAITAEFPDEGGSRFSVAIPRVAAASV
ncbi:MAG: ATP-binding protein [Dehalococcoidia bacterium]